MDDRLGCAIIEDTRHDLTLNIWPNGRAVAFEARHARMVAMSAVHWKSKLEENNHFPMRDYMAKSWTGPIVDNHFHLNRNGRFLDAAADFSRVGGTGLVLVHCPNFASPPKGFEAHKESYLDTSLWPSRSTISSD